MSRLPLTNKGGWILSTDFLEAVKQLAESDYGLESIISWEDIESILLAAHEIENKM
jgi:hypothetical protein